MLSFSHESLTGPYANIGEAIIPSIPRLKERNTMDLIRSSQYFASVTGNSIIQSLDRIEAIFVEQTKMSKCSEAYRPYTNRTKAINRNKGLFC